MKKIIAIFFELLAGIFLILLGCSFFIDRSLHYAIMRRYSYQTFDGFLFVVVGILIGWFAVIQLTGILKQRKSNQSKKIDYS